MGVLDEALKMPLDDVFYYGLKRFEALKSKEPVGYLLPEDAAGIIGILLALSRLRSAYPFGRYKEAEGDAFEKFIENYGLEEALKVLLEYRAIEPGDILTFDQRTERVKDPSILDPKTRRLYFEHKYSSGSEHKDYIAVHRRRGLKHVVEKKFVKAQGPYYGYRIVYKSLAVTMIKHAFEARLERIYENFRARRIVLTKIGEELARELESFATPKGVQIDLESLGENLYERVDLRPPCMQILLLRLKNKGHLIHEERFQLGTFLKRAGMDPETQKRFRYENAVDNVNVPWEVFEKHAGYIIEHIYGLRGSKKDYNVPSCMRARTERYYCPFAKEDPESLRERLKALKVDDGRIDKIVEEASKRNFASYMKACMMFFEAKIGKRPYRGRKNPTGYLYRAARAVGLIKGKKEKKDGSSEGSRRRVRGSLSTGGRGAFCFS